MIALLFRIGWNPPYPALVLGCEKKHKTLQ